MIIEESKDRYIRVLEYKYMKVCMQMEVRLLLASPSNLLGGVDDPPEDLSRRAHRHGNVQEGQQRGHRG